LCAYIPKASSAIIKAKIQASLSDSQASEVIFIINLLSYKGANVSTGMATIEGIIVHEAD
jgi:hypothetical protein